MILFAVFLLAYMLSQFFRAFLAVIAPRLATEIGLTPADLANMSAAWFVVFAFAQFPLGVALDRIGPRRTVPVLMLAGVAGAIVLANARGAQACIAGMALIGLGCSPIYMGALYYYGRTESAARFGFISASMLGFGSAGNLLAATPLAMAAELLGWRPTLLAIAMVMLVSAVLFVLLVRDPPPADQPTVRGSMLAELIQIITLPGFWALMPLLTLGYAALVVERGLWVGPYFAEVHALGPIALGNAVLAMAAAMSVGALAFGAVDRALAGQRKRLVVIGSLLTVLGFTALSVWPAPTLSVGVIVVAWVGFMGLHQPLLFAHARQFFPDHLLGRGMTFANFLTIGGSGIVHFGSGAYVSSLQASGHAAPAVYASLHAAFAAIVALATLVYLRAPVKTLAGTSAKSGLN